MSTTMCTHGYTLSVLKLASDGSSPFGQARPTFAPGLPLPPPPFCGVVPPPLLPVDGDGEGDEAGGAEDEGGLLPASAAGVAAGAAEEPDEADRGLHRLVEVARFLFAIESWPRAACRAKWWLSVTRAFAGVAAKEQARMAKEEIARRFSSLIAAIVENICGLVDRKRTE